MAVASHHHRDVELMAARIVVAGADGSSYSAPSLMPQHHGSDRSSDTCRAVGAGVVNHQRQINESGQSGDDFRHAFFFIPRRDDDGDSSTGKHSASFLRATLEMVVEHAPVLSLAKELVKRGPLDLACGTFCKPR